MEEVTELDCEAALILISAALDGELTEAERQELEAHLAQCPECRALSEDMGVLSVALSDMEQPAPAGLDGRIGAALDALEGPSAAPKPRRRWRQWASLAAMLAVVICLGGVYRFTTAGGGDANSAAPAGAAPAPAPSAAPFSNFSAGQAEARGAESGAESAPADPPSAQPAEGMPADEAPTESSDNSSFGEAILLPTDGGEGDAQTPPDAVPSTAPQTVQEPESAPAEPPAPNGGLAQGKTQPAEGGEVIQPTADPTQDVSVQLDSLQALELVFTHLGGPVAWPGAELDPEKPGYVLERTEEENLDTARMLDYAGLSPNGLYHVFRLYDYSVLYGPNGWASTTSVNSYAVSLDGEALLSEYDDQQTPEHAQAYHDAIGG